MRSLDRATASRDWDTTMITVFLVDDHEIVRRGLVGLLSDDPELSVVGEAGDVAQAPARIPALRPDVAVLDVRLPDGNGIELCRDLLPKLDDVRCSSSRRSPTNRPCWTPSSPEPAAMWSKIKGMELAKAIKGVGAGRSLDRQPCRGRPRAGLRANTDAARWPRSPSRNADFSPRSAKD
jgi:two-component system response regulator DevR